MSTGCEFYADALVDRAAGRLDGERTRRLERHLAECEECREALRVVEAVRGAPVPVPDGLEARIRSAVRNEASATAAREPTAEIGLSDDGGPPAPVRTPVRPRAWPRWSWGLPLAAAAALALVWVGVGGSDGAAEPDVAVVAEAEEIEPFGAWPGADGMVAGDPLLSELTVEELEQLLEELES